MSKFEEYEEIMDILEKWEFLYGQKAYRDLWVEKPYVVQMHDLRSFNSDITKVKDYVNDTYRG